MPEILIFFLAGLAASAVVGLIFYYTIGPASEGAARQAFGQHSGPLWGRSFRLMLFVMALIGGLSTQWYGCGGYRDYAEIAADRRLMFEKSTTQVASATSYARWYLVGAAAVGAVVIPLLAARGPAKRRPGAKPPPGDDLPRS